MSDVVRIEVKRPFEDEWVLKVSVLNGLPFNGVYTCRCALHMRPDGAPEMQFSWSKAPPHVQAVLEKAVQVFLDERLPEADVSTVNPSWMS